MTIASWRSLALLCICSVPLHALAAESTGTVIVNGARLADLRKAMTKAQDRFLNAYNRVNRDIDQQLACSESAPTGSRLTQRSCSTRAQNRATEEQARSYMTAVDSVAANQAQADSARQQATAKAQSGATLSSDDSAALAGRQAPDADVESRSNETAGKVSEEAREFQENLQKLLDKNPELRQRYEEYLTARQHYLEAGGRL
jgi:sulfite reductase alpha subunit-like flavoprotein